MNSQGFMIFSSTHLFSYIETCVLFFFPFVRSHFQKTEYLYDIFSESLYIFTYICICKYMYKINAKECSNQCTIAHSSHTSKVMLKIHQATLQQYENCELPDVQAGFRKGRGTRDQITNIHCIMEKAREFQKNIYFCFIDYAKAFDCVDHNNSRKF